MTSFGDVADVISTIVSFVVVVGIVTSVVWLPPLKKWLDQRIASGVKHQFDKRLEDHRHSLQMLTEAARFDYQRRMQDFSLFASKKHEINARLFELLRIAEGAAHGIRGPGHSLTFEEYNEADLLRYMTDQNIVEGKREEIIKIWQSSKQDGIQALKEYLSVIGIGKAKANRQHVINFVLANELYLLPDVVKAVYRCLALFGNRIADAEYDLDALMRPPIRPQEITEAVEAVRELLRKEISIGYYELSESRLPATRGEDSST